MLAEPTALRNARLFALRPEEFKSRAVAAEHDW